MTARGAEGRVPLLGWMLAGGLWTWGWARLGPGMTADTMDYVGIGRAPFALDPDVFQWPPAFWLLLQLARVLGCSPWGAAILVMCGARAVLAGGAYRLGRTLAGPPAGHGLAVLTGCWVPLTYAGLYCLSDVLFLAAVVWWLGSAHAVRADPPDLTHRVWRTTAWAALMVSTRFVGAPLAFVEWVVAAWVLRDAKHPHWRRTALGTGMCIVAPALLWAALGAAVTGEAVGTRHPTRHPLSVHLMNLGTGWWEPLVRGRYGDVFWGDQGAFAAPAATVQAALYLGALVLGWVALHPRRGGAPLWRTRIAVAATLYVLMLVTVSARVWIDPIGPRFLLPLVFLVMAAGCHPLRWTRWNGWSIAALGILGAAWMADGALGAGLTARFGTGVLAGLGFGGALCCLGAAWLAPTEHRSLQPMRAVVWAVMLVLLAAHVRWSAELLAHVAQGALPSVQHPGWRRMPAVRALRARVASGDTIYTHTEDAVRAVLDDRRDVRVEPFCFRRLDPACEPSLVEYVRALDGRSRTGAEWIVLLDRVFVPYLFLEELHGLAADRPWVEVLEVDTLWAYRWEPGAASGAPPRPVSP